MRAAAHIAQSDGWGALGLAPDPALRVFGMRRSGNHAVINWLTRNHNGQGSVFLNNCIARRDVLSSARTIEVNGTRHGLADAGPSKRRRLLQSAGAAPMIVVSYEDTAPSATASLSKTTAYEFSHNILIYRSFLNWSASMLRKLQRNAGYGAITRARIMTRLMESYHSCLSLLSDVAGICYDRWLIDEAYRADRLQSLGLPLRDNTLGPVQSYGGGSSFQPDAETPTELTPQTRAAEMAGDPEYQMILWTAAQDGGFLQTLAAEFPDDAAHLSTLTGTQVSAS